MCVCVQAAVYQYGGVDVHGQQVPSYDRSLTPLLPSDAADPSVCYVPNAYQQPYYYGTSSSFLPKPTQLVTNAYLFMKLSGYGASGQDWSEFTGYNPNLEGVEMSTVSLY